MGPCWVARSMATVRLLHPNDLGHEGVFGFHILMTLPGAGPWDPTPGCYGQPWWTPPGGNLSPSLAIRPPGMRKPSFSSLPLRGTRLLPPPLHLRRRDGRWSLWILCPKHHNDGGCSWSPWPLYGLLSLAPHKAPGPASSSEVGRLVLLAAGSGSRSALPSSSSPRIIAEKYIERFPWIIQIKHVTCQHTETYRTCRAGQLILAVLG